MTHEGMFEDAEKIKYLENQNKLLKKKLKESVMIKTIDLLETHATIKDYQILKLREEVTALKEALEKTE